MSLPDAPLSVEISHGRLVISIGVETMAHVVEVGSGFEEYDPRTKQFLHPKITDPWGFAHDVLRELESEQEDGTTPVHLLLDRAADEAINNGSQYVDMPPMFRDDAE